MKIENKRKFDLFKLTKDCSFGTLWWVANSIWKRNKKLWFETVKKKHPGVSVSPAWPDENPQVVSMLFGSSKPQYNAFVADLLDRRGRKTYFLCMEPVKLEYLDFFGDLVTESSPKRRLDPEETARLEQYVEEKLK